MLAAELGNEAILVLLAENNADLRLQDAQGKGEQREASSFAVYACADGDTRGEQTTIVSLSLRYWDTLMTRGINRTLLR